MAAFDYADFDLEITRLTESRYRAQVVDSPAGQSSTDFSSPFTEMELENFVLKIGHTRTGVRRIDSLQMQAVEAFGKKLYDTVFQGEVRDLFTTSLNQIDSGKIFGLRLKLRLIEVPELADLPWEYLYNPARRRFIVLSNETPITRYVNLPRPVKPFKVANPLRLLVVIASPTDQQSLDVQREKDKIKNGLADLEQRGLIVVEWLEQGTLSALQKRLREQQIHILHFIGHGGWDGKIDDGVLLFEDEYHRGFRVSARNLATILHDHRSLRLVVLNACEGARTSKTDPFAGVATTLIEQGIPAVVAMQFEITDKAAIQLAQEFYDSLAKGYPADAALSEARKAIFASGNDVEWGTPVLYLRAPDGILFDLSTELPGKKSERLASDSTEQEMIIRETPRIDQAVRTITAKPIVQDTNIQEKQPKETTPQEKSQEEHTEPKKDSLEQSGIAFAPSFSPKWDRFLIHLPDTNKTTPESTPFEDLLFPLKQDRYSIHLPDTSETTPESTSLEGFPFAVIPPNTPIDTAEPQYNYIHAEPHRPDPSSNRWRDEGTEPLGRIRLVGSRLYLRLLLAWYATEEIRFVVIVVAVIIVSLAIAMLLVYGSSSGIPPH